MPLVVSSPIVLIWCSWTDSVTHHIVSVPSVVKAAPEQDLVALCIDVAELYRTLLHSLVLKVFT